MMIEDHRRNCSIVGCSTCKDISDKVGRTHITKRAQPGTSDSTIDQKKKRIQNFDVFQSVNKDDCIQLFDTWTAPEQVDFLCQLLSKMSPTQQSLLNCLLEPLLQRDFIMALQEHGVSQLASPILSRLDASSLRAAELVSKGWQWALVEHQLWRKLLLRRLNNDSVWYGLAERRGWLNIIQSSDPTELIFLLEERMEQFGLKNALVDFPLLEKDYQLYKTLLSYFKNYKKDALNLSSISNSMNSDYDDDYQAELSPNDMEVAETSKIHFRLSEIDKRLYFQALFYAHRFYKQLYPRIVRDIKRVDQNWAAGYYHLTRIYCRSDVTKGVYCLQYDSEKIVSGLRDDTIKIWSKKTESNRSSTTLVQAPVIRRRLEPILENEEEDDAFDRRQVNVDEAGLDANNDDIEGPVLDFELDEEANNLADDDALPAVGDEAILPQRNSQPASSDEYHCTQVLKGHTGSVLCLQYEDDLLISGSSDTTVRMWNISSGECIKSISYHTEAVLHLRFRDNLLVTCSKDRSIAVWELNESRTDAKLKKSLVGHRAAVNVVDFDDTYIVSASGDRTIKVWSTETCAYVRSLVGHRRGIACLQYRDRLVVSGSSDNTIRIWDIENGVCFRVLEGHDELVRCIRFDSERIVSGAYDGKIKIWNLRAALNPRTKPDQICIRTLHQHTGRVFRLQFDDFQIVSSSHDDTILIWDFVRFWHPHEDGDDGFDDGQTPGPVNNAQGPLVPPGASVDQPNLEP